MTTSPKAEMSTSAAQRNIRRLNDYNDLINFEPREYDNGYTSPRYQGDICRPFIPIPTQYEYHISNEEEEDDCIIVVDSDDVQVLPLHDVVTDNRYRNVNYQEEYEERYLQQRTDRVYAHEY